MSSISLNGDTSGSILIQAPAVAGSGTLTLPTGSGTILAGGPLFFAYSSAEQTLSSGWTILQINTEIYDTSNCFNTSTYAFTPNVAGYYQCNWNVSFKSGSGAPTNFVASIYKNNTTEFVRGSGTPTALNSGYNYYFSGSGLVYCNGTTDFLTIQMYASGAATLQSGQQGVAFSGFLARAA